MSEQFTAYMFCCADTICDEIKHKAIKQRDVALSYALAMRSAAANIEDVDFGKINHAILNRWSMAGLERIKKAAWDLCSGKVTPENVMKRKSPRPTPEDGGAG